MLKELKDLKGCLCEQKENTEIELANGSYTSLEAVKNKYGLSLVAFGEGEAEYEPNYCPFCGRQLRHKE